jgi:hypothetical protein
VLIKSLAYDPAHRYGTCEEFADRLRQALALDTSQHAVAYGTGNVIAQ